MNLLGLTLLTGLCLARAEVSKAPPGFLELGSMAAGLSYSHIHTFINLTAIKESVKGRVKFADLTHNSTLKALRQHKDVRLGTLSAQWKSRYNHYAGLLLSRLDEIEDKLRLAELDEDHVRTDGRSVTASDDHTREKRQAFGAILGGVGLGLSIYNTYEIYELDSRVDNMEDHLLHYVEASNTQFKKIENNEEKLRNVTSKLEKTVTSLKREFYTDFIHTRLDFDLRELERAVTRIETSVSFVLLGQVPAFLFDSQVIEKEAERLGRKLKLKGMKFAHPILRDLYRFEASMVVRGGGVRVFIHVPITSGTPLKIFKMLRAPFFGKNGLLFTVRTPRDILIIDEEHTQSMAVTAGELALCRNSGRMFYCDSMRTFSREPSRSCVGSVFTGHLQHMKEYCQIGVEHLGESMEMINNTAMVVLSTQGKVQLQKTCSSEWTAVKSGQVVNVEEGCTAFTEHYWFMAGGEVESPSEVVHSNILVDEGFLELGELSIMDVKEHATLKLQKLDLASLEDIKQDILRTRRQSHHILTQVVSTVAAVAALVLFLGLVAWCCLKRRQGNQRRILRQQRKVALETAPLEMSKL